MRLFETTSELKPDAETERIQKAVDNFFNLSTDNKLLKQLSSEKKDERHNFYFRPSLEYTKLLLEIGIHKTHGFFYNSIISNSLSDIIEIGYDSISDIVHSEWRSLNRQSIMNENLRFDYDGILTVITSLDGTEVHIIEQAIDLNEWTKKEYSEAYLPFLNELAERKLKELNG